MFYSELSVVFLFMANRPIWSSMDSKSSVEDLRGAHIDFESRVETDSFNIAFASTDINWICKLTFAKLVRVR